MRINPILLCKRLAEMEFKAATSLPDGWKVPDAMQHDYADMIGDLLGVPADNSVEYFERYGDLEASEIKGFYSRDWLNDAWYEVVFQSADVASFVNSCIAEFELSDEE